MAYQAFARAAALIAAWIVLSVPFGSVSAQDTTYRIEAVSERIGTGENVRIEVRVTGPDDQPVIADTITVTKTRLDMAPDDMPMMDTPLTAMPSDDPYIIAFETEIVMAGRWLLTIEASVNGIAEAIKGEVIFTAVKEEAKTNPAASAAGEDRKIAYYRNPMGLADISKVPKKDSMGMDYIPVYEDELTGPEGSVRISLDKVQRAGVRTEPVELRSLVSSVRGAGMIVPDEARMAIVSAKFDGFVESLDVRTTGEQVETGQRLMKVWIESRDVINMIIDLRSVADQPAAARRSASGLRLFDIPEADIERIIKSREAVRTIAFNAPFTGTVLEKPALDGMRFSAGDMLFKIADLSQLWVVAEIAEQDLPLIRAGQKARLALPSLPGQVFEGRVEFVYPEMNMQTRSGRIRIVIPNEDGDLKVGQFATVNIEASLGETPSLTIPASAVIDDGTRTVAFVSKGEGLFEPRDLVLGARAGDLIEVREGLEEDELVVVNGTFLIDAESNLQAALAAFATADSEQ